MFLDPNDNSRVVLVLTFNGFIVPSENTNLFIFSPTARYNFDIENTGDALIDQSYRVTFSRKTAASAAQTATIELPGGRTFTAIVTPSSHLTAGPAADPVLTTDPVSNITFYAGIQDDPFFFDIVGFGRFHGLDSRRRCRRDHAQPRTRQLRRLQHSDDRSQRSRFSAERQRRQHDRIERDGAAPAASIRRRQRNTER